jgi:hypothetical protein
MAKILKIQNVGRNFHCRGINPNHSYGKHNFQMFQKKELLVFSHFNNHLVT